MLNIRDCIIFSLVPSILNTRDCFMLSLVRLTKTDLSTSTWCRLSTGFVQTNERTRSLLEIANTACIHDSQY